MIKNNSINNKTVLVTGATGSFGTSFIENILKNNKPSKVIIYSRDEFKQHNLSKIFKKFYWMGKGAHVGEGDW